MEKTRKAIFKRAFCIFLTGLLLCSLCACGHRRTTGASLGASPSASTGSQSGAGDDGASAIEETSPLELALEERIDEYKQLSTQELSEEEKGLLARTITLTPEAAQAAAAACALETEYAYSDLFALDEALRVYEQRVEPYDGEVLPILADGELDADELYAAVKENTAAYLKQPDTPAAYHELDDEVVRYACQVIARTVSEELKNEAMRVNLDDLSYNLAHLSIVTGISFANASVHEDGSMGLNPNFMESMNTIAGTEYAYDCTISHEVEHLFQRSCNEARKDRFRMGFGFAYQFDELAVNSLYNSWLTEASAEMLATRLYGIAPTTYRTKIGYANSLFLVNGLRTDFDPYNAPRLCLETDVYKAASRFGCDSEEDVKEFLTMMYSIDILQEEPEDFLKAYLTSQGREDNEEISDEEMGSLKRELKAGIMEYLSKKFYGNLAQRLTGQPTTVEELYTLLSVFECDLNSHIQYYTDEDLYEEYASFYKRYSDMQAAFFEALSQVSGTSAEELLEDYYTFFGRLEAQQTSSFYETEWKQIGISWMTSEELRVVQQVYEDTISHKTVALGEFLQLREQVLH